MVPVGVVLEPGQVLPVLPPQESLDGGDRTLDQIEHPHRAAGPQRPVERREDLPPFRVGAQVVQHGSGQHDVEALVGEFDLPDVALNGLNGAGGRPPHPLRGPVQHKLAQVD
jgi:hypothetical protein